MNIKRVVITGAAGFIGSSLAKYFDNNFKDISVLAIDKFRSDECFSG